MEYEKSAIDRFAETVNCSDKKRLLDFITAFIGDPKPDTSPGVISSYVSWSYDGKVLKYAKMSTSEGYHDLHDSETSVAIKPVSCRPDGWLVYTKELDQNSGSGFKTYYLLEDCKEVYTENEKIWNKPYGAGFSSPAPGNALFCVCDPPGLIGWYELEYEIYWD